MAKRDSEKRAERRRLAKAGRRKVLIEVFDWDAWAAIMREEECLEDKAEATTEALTAATEKFIWEWCRQYNKDVADEQMGFIQRVRTGLYNPEAMDAEFEERAKKEPHLIYGKPKTPLFDPPKPAPVKIYTPEERAEYLFSLLDNEVNGGTEDGDAIGVDFAATEVEGEGDDAEDFVGDGDT